MNINHENSISRRTALFCSDSRSHEWLRPPRRECEMCPCLCERVWSVSVFIYITQSGEQVHSTHNARSKTSSLSAALEKSSVTLYYSYNAKCTRLKTRYGQGIFKTQLNGQQPE
jgi:hypothetical protein